MAHFSISGDDLAALVRDLMLSDEPERAYRLLTTSLTGGPPGLVEHWSPKILDGHARLSGNASSMECIEEEDADYQAQLKSVYAGRFQVAKRWYRPRAKVIDLGPEDVPSMPGIPLSLPEYAANLRAWSRARVEHYGRPGEVAFGNVLFEPCGALPHWWVPNRDAESALEEWTSTGNPLETTGWTDVHGSNRIDNLADILRKTDHLHKKDARLDSIREAEEHQRIWDNKIRDARQKILAQAGNDLFDLTLADKSTVRIPTAPFTRWALNRTTLKHLAPAWINVSASGWKLVDDDPDHTDWMVGAGLDLGKAYEIHVQDAILDKVTAIQSAMGNFEVAVLIGGSPVHDVIGPQGIVVLPDLSPGHVLAIQSARAIVTERGGAMAHLSSLARERAIPVLRVKDACRVFRPGMRVSLYPDQGRIEVHPFE